MITVTTREVRGLAIRYPATPLNNRLLAALSQEVQGHWLPLLEPVELTQGHVLGESGVPIPYLYFPTNAIVSLMYVLEDGASAEVAMVGADGVIGISLFLSGGHSRSWAVVHTAGSGYRLRTDVARATFDQSPEVRSLMLRFTQALSSQIAQIAVCNRHHSLEQQLCRCLLLCLDRLQGNELVMTHELIASLLGVRREGVTEAALRLQKSGVISYSRGHIHVLDRPALEKRACECYQAISSEYRRLLPAPANVPR